MNKTLFILGILILFLGGFNCKNFSKKLSEEKNNTNTDSSIDLSVGKKLPNFSQNQPNDEPLELNSLAGKFVLVDFWASWCQPCRKENKNLVKIYEKYSSMNFEILMVSLDKNKEDWVEGIQQDNLNWYHVSDLNFWDNAVARNFEITYIPFNFLIDPEGTIIAKNIHGEELDHFLHLKLK